MWEAILQAAGIVFAAIVGARAAHAWQLRSSSENRFFEASKDVHARMSRATEQLIGRVGRRLYHTQRLCLVPRSSKHFDALLTAYRDAVVEWNENLLEMEMNVRTLFTNSYLTSFEYLQSRLAALTREVDSHVLAGRPAARLLPAVATLRGEYFQFAQEMHRETELLHRQMHFGVRIPFDPGEMESFSTRELLAALLAGPEQPYSVLRSPRDLGTPIGSDEARFRVNKH